MKLIVVCAHREQADGGDYLGMFCSIDQAENWAEQQQMIENVTGYSIHQKMLEDYEE